MIPRTACPTCMGVGVHREFNFESDRFETFACPRLVKEEHNRMTEKLLKGPDGIIKDHILDNKEKLVGKFGRSTFIEIYEILVGRVI